MASKSEPVVKVSVSLEELVTALREMKDEDREWFLENLLAATSPDYLKSIRVSSFKIDHGSHVVI